MRFKTNIGFAAGTWGMPSADGRSLFLPDRESGGYDQSKTIKAPQGMRWEIVNDGDPSQFASSALLAEGQIVLDRAHYL